MLRQLRSLACGNECRFVPADRRIEIEDCRYVGPRSLITLPVRDNSTDGMRQGEGIAGRNDLAHATNSHGLARARNVRRHHWRSAQHRFNLHKAKTLTAARENDHIAAGIKIGKVLGILYQPKEVNPVLVLLYYREGPLVEPLVRHDVLTGERHMRTGQGSIQVS